MSMMQMLLGAAGALPEDVYWWNLGAVNWSIPGRGVAVDNDGNIYQATANTGYVRGCLVSFDKEGDIRWSSLDGYSLPCYNGCAVDNAGAVYVFPEYITGTGAGSYSQALFKFNTSDGSEATFSGGSDDGAVWRKCFGTTSYSSYDKCGGVVVDSNGHPTVLFTSKKLSGDKYDPTVIKFNKDTGAATWVTRLHDTSKLFYANEYGNSNIAIDSNDNIYIAVWTTASLGFTNSNGGIVVAKLPADGSAISYQRKIAISSSSGANMSNPGIVVDKDDNVVITGMLPFNAPRDELMTYILKLDDELEITWGRSISFDNSSGTHVKNYNRWGKGDTDKDGNIYCNAWLQNSQSTNLGGSGDNGIFKVDSDGNNLEVIAFGSSGEDQASGELAINKVGSIVCSARLSDKPIMVQLPSDMSITGGNYSGHSLNFYVTKPSDESGNSTWHNTNVRTGSGDYIADGAYTGLSYDDYSGDMTYAEDTSTHSDGEDAGAPITIS